LNEKVFNVFPDIFQLKSIKVLKCSRTAKDLKFNLMFNCYVSLTMKLVLVAKRERGFLLIFLKCVLRVMIYTAPVF